jgi:feruloyl esterase
MSFMMPPDELNLDKLRNHGGKMIVVQGTADGVFSVDDTQNWYDQCYNTIKMMRKVQRLNLRVSLEFQNHTRDGIATDQFDALTALVTGWNMGKHLTKSLRLHAAQVT